jgi:hypothetical protein
MPKGMRNPREEQTLESSGGGGMGGGGGRMSMTAIADKSAVKNKTNMADEMIAADKKLSMKRELETAQAKPERQKAEKNATVSTEGGVKTTKYPYVGPNEYAKGGKVSSASKRADGIAQRGKTKGRYL